MQKKKYLVRFKGNKKYTEIFANSRGEAAKKFAKMNDDNSLYSKAKGLYGRAKENYHSRIKPIGEKGAIFSDRLNSSISNALGDLGDFGL